MITNNTWMISSSTSSRRTHSSMLRLLLLLTAWIVLGLVTHPSSFTTVVVAEELEEMNNDGQNNQGATSSDTDAPTSAVASEEEDDEYKSATTTYVIDPLDYIDDDWTTSGGSISLELETGDFMFGRGSLKVSYSLLNLSSDSSEAVLATGDARVGRVDDDAGDQNVPAATTTDVVTPSTAASSSSSSSTAAVSFGWLLSTPNWTYNCFGATDISLWYKPLRTTGNEVIRVVFYDDTPCLLQYSETGDSDMLSKCVTDEDALDRYVVMDQSITKSTNSESWRELKIPISAESSAMDLRRLRGWKVEIAPLDDGTTEESVNAADAERSSILIDQLSCVGDGRMFGSAFATGEWVDFGRKQLSQSSPINPIDEYWYYAFYQSEISANSTVISLSRDGMLSVDYTVEQVEDWGGFVEVGAICPGNAYYNVSAATDIQITYNVTRAASQKERAIFRFVLQDTSHCTVGCDVDGFQSERYYSFNPILDEITTEGSQKLMIPLVGGDSPDNPFWLTGWSGITGNAILDTSHLKGFFLEVVLDSQLGIGSLVDGQVQFSNIALLESAASKGVGSTSSQNVNDQCRVESLFYLKESMPTFKRLEFLGAECCEVCANDPECLFALSSGRDCFVAAEIEPNYASLLTWKPTLGEKVFWMDSAEKRGDFCDICDCRDKESSIDCRGRDLVIIPKTFTPLEPFAPIRLDLRDNPRLNLIGVGSLEAIESNLEEILLPFQLTYIGFDFFDSFPLLSKIQFEEPAKTTEAGSFYATNFITSSDGSFSEICCSRGDRVDREFDPSGVSIEFCDFSTTTPGIDSLYFPFTKYPDDSPLIALLYPSSEFMSEAAESVEKCAEFCSITSSCRFFAYDARYPNAEHSCFLLTSITGPAEEKCCEQDDYADLNRTLPGWTTGVPPRTRNDDYNATVKVPYSTVLTVSPENEFSTEYSLSLGTNPIRGAVWVEPIVRTGGFDVEISPRKVVFYDSSTSKTVKIKVRNVGKNSRTTLVIENSIKSCDTAFLDAQNNVIYVEVRRDNDQVNLAVVIPIVLVLALVIACIYIAFFYYQSKKSHEDSLWKVEKEELHFDSPPVVLGRGTFGLVLQAEYRGTKVAVKRAVPPRNNKSLHFSMMDISSEELNEKGRESGSKGYIVNGSGSYAKGRISISRAFSIFSKNVSTASQNGGTSSKSFDQLKADFVEEMRILSRLRHPCITTVMGGVLSKEVEPMLVMEMMEHGSLYDLLHNETFVLEGDVVLNILRDISQGIRFLHVAEPQVIHGDLKAANILVDQKFRAKVADFGLSQKQRLGATGTPFWMAPELLRSPEIRNTASTDIYAFGIILYEVYSRKDPYCEEDEDVQTILEKIANEGKRPPVPPSSPAEVQSLMTSCLLDESDQRPTAEEIDVRLRRAVAAQVAPQREVRMSLFDMFPSHIAKALEDGRDIEPEHREEVTIFFSDIVGFTNLSSTLSPQKVARMLDRLYHQFDELSAKHDLYKVETIGDAYLAVTNLVKDQPHDHAKRIAEFAIDAVKAANATLIDPDDESKGYVEIRVGFHSGPIVADVVGNRNRKYTLFGDTINTASRMESTSKTNRIHCSEASALLLRKQAPFLPLRSRGIRPIKGKGFMTTYWVNEGDATNKPHVPFSRRHTAPDDFAMLQWAGQLAIDLDLEELDDESDIENGEEHGMGGSVDSTVLSTSQQDYQRTSTGSVLGLSRDDIEIGSQISLSKQGRRVSFDDHFKCDGKGGMNCVDDSAV